MKSKKLKIVHIIDILIRLYFLAFAVFTFYTHNYVHSLVSILTLLVTFYAFAIEKVFKIELSTHLRVAISVFIFLSQGLGTLLKFYDTFSWWDIFLHFTSGFLIYLIGREIFIGKFAKNTKNLKYYVSCIFALSFAMAIANLWEIGEYSVDRLFGFDTQRAGELIGQEALNDTMEDLVVSTIGAGITFTADLVRSKHQRKNPK